ncbi:MAG: hypothetical protein MI784_02870 [Cytophagales bacterium]|nr:hypothetical protein [Cytophagales bacterium]
MFKKYILGISLASMLFSSCNPLEDINKELDAKQAVKDELIQKNLSRTLIPESGAYTLATIDYDSMGTKDGQPGKYDSFSEKVDPKAFIPGFLYKKFEILTEEKTLNVTYDFYTPSSYKNSEATAYVMTAEDYDLLGTGKYQPGEKDRFSASDKTKPAEYIQVVLRNNFNASLKGEEKVVQYKLYKRFYEDRKQEYAYDGTVWTLTNKTEGLDNAYKMVDADYQAIGGGVAKYKNFSKYAKAQDYLPAFLKTKFSNAASGDKKVIQYNYSYTKILIEAINFTFDGVAWQKTENVSVSAIEGSEKWKVSKKTPGKTEPVSLDFTFKPSKEKVNEGSWVPDNSVKYTLEAEDYAQISEAADKYNNFDIRAGKAYADRAAIVKDLGAFLEKKFSSEVESGELFTITYAYYNGSSDNGSAIIKVQKADGAWKEVTE